LETANRLDLAISQTNLMERNPKQVMLPLTFAPVRDSDVAGATATMIIRDY